MSIPKIDQEVLDIHNSVRENPRTLIPALDEMKKNFEGLLLKKPGKTTLRTKEGAAAVDEAIAFLQK
jgi:hypothetical protein